MGIKGFIDGTLSQIGTIMRAKRQEWDDNSIQVIWIDEDGYIDPEIIGDRLDGDMVAMPQLQRVQEIRREYRNKQNGRPVVIACARSFKTEDIAQTFDVVAAHEGEPVYLDMREYQEVKIKDAKKEGGKAKNKTVRVFTQADVSRMVYRVISAKVNNMFQEPSFNFTILVGAAMFAAGLVAGLIAYAFFLA